MQDDQRRSGHISLSDGFVEDELKMEPNIPAMDEIRFLELAVGFLEPIDEQSRLRVLRWLNDRYSGALIT